MSNTQNDFNQIVDKLVAEKTFGLEALQGIDDLKKAHARVTQELYDKNEQYKSLSAAQNAALEKLRETQKELDYYKNREDLIYKREQNMMRLEIEKECADKMVGHTLGMFNTVFRNTTLRETVLRDVVIPVEGQQPNQYNSCGMPGHAEKHSTMETTTTSQD